MRETGYPLHRRGFLTLAGFATLAAAVPTPALARGASAVQNLSGNAFGTGWRVSLPDGVDAAALRGPIGALLAEGRPSDVALPR